MFLSCQDVIAVFTRVSHCDLVHAGVCRRERGGGSPYFWQIICTWLAQVVEVLLHIFSMYRSMAWTVLVGLLHML